MNKKQVDILNYYQTFAIHTLGCKVNLYESEIIANQLRSIGLLEVDFKSKADIYVINTCSVTNTADAKSRNVIAKAHKLNPHALVIVCGCYSQNYTQEVKDKLHADIVIGNKYKNQIIKLIEAYLNNEKKQLVEVKNLMLENTLEFSFLDDFAHHTRAFIKIQDGCNFMCSYCSIPFSRGKQRSVNFDDILTNIKKLISNGYKEIVLTGVNTAGYQNGNYNFYDLLKAINDLEGDFRIRISSVEPFQISDEIIELICLHPNRFCNHWHICLQAGNNQILALMNRKYNKEMFLTLLNKIYKLSPNCAISTDIIVGFPSETNDQFIDGLNFIKECKFSFLHVFPYSKRKYTKAASLENQVSDQVKKERMQEMLELSNQLQKSYLHKFKDQTIKVLWEKIEDNLLIGKSSEYCDVITDKIDKFKINEISEVKVLKVFNSKLIV